MYISAERHQDDVLVWERNHGVRELITYRAPYYFYTKDPNGEYTSMYGDKLTIHTFTNGRDFYQAKQHFKDSRTEMFESDIPPELKVLSKEYHEKPAPELNVTFLDIENDYDTEIGYATLDNPYAPINAVAFYHSHKNQYVVLAVPPDVTKWDIGQADKEMIRKLDEIAELDKTIDLEVYICLNERELLIRLLDEIEDSDVLSGWNSDLFDIPYIGKRLEILGTDYFNRLSFKMAKNPSYREYPSMGIMATTLDLGGRISSDYMILFKKYEMSERPSYKLAAIADEFLPDLPKLEYEGTLASLYGDDFLWFIRYNIRDTEILKGFEDVLGYVDVANQMVHLSTGLFKHVTGTLKLAELATINYCHHNLNGLIVNDVNRDPIDGQIQGALVLLPQVGMHKNTGSVDVKSLYPSGIRLVNISPEKIRGQCEALQLEPLKPEHITAIKASGYVGDYTEANKFRKNVFEYAAELIADKSSEHIKFTLEDGRHWVGPASDLHQTLKDNNWAVSGFGTIFDQNEPGIIPMILGYWYNKRVEYKKLMNAAMEDGDSIKSQYYDKLQYVFKIKLNSFYGALTNAYFRFYDLRMGESTTATGRKILIHQCAQACKILDGEYLLPNNIKFDPDVVDGVNKFKWHYGYTKDFSVVYGDTDSSYFSTRGVDDNDAIRIGDRVSVEINQSFPAFMKKTFLVGPEYEGLIECEREVITSRGIFVDKKRYILHLINIDGRPCDKLKVMGLDTKKTTMPKYVADKLNSFIERLLKGEEWKDISVDIVNFKEKLRKTEDILSIGLPKGIKKVESYTEKYNNDQTTFLPGHVAASIHYNMGLDDNNDYISDRIITGMKIKVFYITKPVGRFKTISLPVDINVIPNWFTNGFTIDRDAHIERLVNKPLLNITKAIGVEVPSRQSLFVDSLLVF